MEYVPPYGRESEGESASYINGDPSAGIQGSIPPANAFEFPLRELVHIIEKSLFIPDPHDLYQVIKAIRSQRVNFVQDTGSVNNLSVACEPPLSAYTLGLVLRVQVANTNTGASRINAGAGVVAIRKMSGADTAAGDLPAGGVAELVFDGTVFQLTNYGGTASGGGPSTVYEVKIPYCVDTSTTPGIITANFSPAITALQAGDEIAVKIANTAPGATVMHVNGLPAINCMPNGGGEMLQGDMHAGNVVIFFYDGNNLYFQPDPSIDASVIYNVGAGQHWTSVAQAMSVLARKAIGPSGHVTLQLQRQVYTEAMVINHPNADRITLAGTMIGANPAWNDFSVSGSDPASLARDALANINMLRSRYGTEIQVGTADASIGIQNNGPGQPALVNLLLTGAQYPPANPSGPPFKQWGIHAGTGLNIYCQNVTVWGTQAGWKIDGDCNLSSCWASACGNVGIECDGGVLWADTCGVFGTTLDGWLTHTGLISTTHCQAFGNGRNGLVCVAGGNGYIVYSQIYNNGAPDLLATTAAQITCTGSTFNSSSPAQNTTGNVGATISSGPYPTQP
jgi:hypothetical protein